MDFTVITSGNKDEIDKEGYQRILTLEKCWKREFITNMQVVPIKRLEEWTQEELMKVALSGIKYVNAFEQAENERNRMNSGQAVVDQQRLFDLIESLFRIMEHIKLKNLIKIFPVDKTYDGEKWESKDYFYTMDVINKIGLENTVGQDKMFEFLWDYENADLRKITIRYMLLMNAMYREKTGDSLTDKIYEEFDLNNQTGYFTKMSKPSFMEIVK